MQRESKFQHEVICQLKHTFPGCIVMKNDANYIQGIPDLIILYKDMWAALECKRSKNESHRPNQDFYISLMDEMSYASFIYPENKEKVINELQQTFRIGR